MSFVHVVSALFFLRATSLRNLVVSRVKRLKQPKYLFGAIVGIAYLYFAFGRQGQSRRNTHVGDAVASVPVDYASVVITAGALVLLVVVLFQWLWPRNRAALSFTEAEIAFLFPAPINRRALIHYRLIDLHSQLIFSSLVLAWISGQWGFMQPHFVLRMMSWWLLFSVGALHTIGSSFALTALLDRGMSSLRRQFTLLLVVAVVLIAAGIGTWRAWRAPNSDDASGFAGIITYLDSMLGHGPIGVLLIPLKWLVVPMVSDGVKEFFLVIGPALLVHAVLYWWVLSSEASFEEASIARAAKRTAKIAAMNSGNFRMTTQPAKARRAPFALSSAKRVEFAFLWKNLLSTAQYLAPRKIFIAIMVAAAISTWLVNSDHDVITNVVAMIATMMAAYVFVFGPMVARQDFRSDMANTDILKMYPLRGWQVVFGQILAPIMVVSMIMWLFLVVVAITIKPEHAWLTSHVRLFGSIAIAIVIPLLCAVQVLVLNAGVIVFPAWSQLGAGGQGGVDQFGQRILLFAALLLAIVAAMLPAVLVAALVTVISFWIVGASVAAVIAFVTLVVMLVAEIGWGINWLGQRFESFDLSAELRP